MTPREHRLTLARIDALMDTSDPSAALKLIREDRGELSDIIRDTRGRLSPHLAGAALECVLSRGSVRRKLGAFFTPPWLVDHVIRESLGRTLQEGGMLRPPRVCDPSCGSGNFLLGVVEYLTAHGIPKDIALTKCVFGVDINPFATELCRDVLTSHAEDVESVKRAVERNIRTGDAVRGSWPHGAQRETGFQWLKEFAEAFADGGFDVVVGNPPFLNQLETRTTESRADAAWLRAQSSGLISRYADLSAAFVLLASKLTRTDGRFAMVLPQSIISGNDVAPVRKLIAETCSLEHFWLAAEHVFRASVYTCVIAAKKAPTRTHNMSRRSHSELREHPNEAISSEQLANWSTWSPLAADLTEIPKVTVDVIYALRDFADATADFRDEYYALKDALIDREIGDDTSLPRVVTTGLITPGAHDWGLCDAKIHGIRYRYPRADRALLSREQWTASWLARRLTPKVLVASQTKVLECIDDRVGGLLPVTPLISVTPNSSVTTTKLAAALSSPVLCALALTRFGCGALHTDSIKLSASQLLTLPMPSHAPSWDRAVELFGGFARSESAARRFGEATLEAFNVPESQRETLLHWWIERLLPKKGHKRRK